MLLVGRRVGVRTIRPSSASRKQRHVSIAATAFDGEEAGKTGRRKCLALATQFGYTLFDGFGSCVSSHDDLPSKLNNEFKLDPFRSPSPQIARKRCHHILSRCRMAIRLCVRSHAWLSWFALSLDMLLLHRTLSSSASPGRLICLQLPDWLRLSAQNVSRAPVDRRTAFHVSWTHLCREILKLQA